MRGGLGSAAQLRSELDLISRVADRVVRSRDFGQALEILVEGASELLQVERASLLMLDEDRRTLSIRVARGLSPEVVANTRVSLGEGIAGSVAASGVSLLSRDVRQLPIWRETESREEYQDPSLLSIPIIFDGRVQGVMNFNHKKSGEPFDERDLEAASGLVKQAAVALYAAQLHREVLEKKRLEAELEVARSIQQRLLPRRIPRVDGFDLAARCQMCQRVGGDYYDFEAVDDHRLVIAIGDVAGHGIGSALLATSARAWFKAAVRQRLGLEACVAQLNNLFLEEAEPHMFMTLLVAELDAEARRFRYVSAGHPMPMLVRDGRAARTAVVAANIPIGVDPGLPFVSEEPIALEPGDLLCLVTDGPLEAEAPDGTHFGWDRLARALVDGLTVEGGTGEVIETLASRLRAHRKGNEPTDDSTAIMLRAL